MKETRKVDPKYYREPSGYFPLEYQESGDEWNELIFKIVDYIIEDYKSDDEVITEAQVFNDFNWQITQFVENIEPYHIIDENTDVYSAMRTEYYQIKDIAFSITNYYNPLHGEGPSIAPGDVRVVSLSYSQEFEMTTITNRNTSETFMIDLDDGDDEDELAFFIHSQETSLLIKYEDLLILHDNLSNIIMSYKDYK